MNKNLTKKYIKNVKVKSLIPQQQTRVASKILRSADCYQQRFIKYPHIGIFHSYCEFLHAALLESDSMVESFIPQPYQFKIQNKPYIPDVYYVVKGKLKVIEIKPEGKFKDEFKIPLEIFLKKVGIEFLVISNEEILKQEIKALNWLHIVRSLVNSIDIDSSHEEVTIMDSFITDAEQELGDIVQVDNRIDKGTYEIALFRLLHRGLLKINCDESHLNLNTEVSLCI